MIKLQTGTSAGMVSLGVVPGVLSEGMTGTQLSATQPIVDATWDIQTAVTGLSMDLVLMWPMTSEVNAFNRAESFVAMHNGTAWDSVPISAATGGPFMFSQSRTGITSPGRFAVFDSNTDPTNVQIVPGANGITVYPNPSASGVIIVENQNAETLRAEVTTITGELAGNYILSGMQPEIDLSGLASGTYLLRLTTGNSITVKRIIKL
jgi:hypothetical protein